jgi:hypothetical protein
MPNLLRLQLEISRSFFVENSPYHRPEHDINAA